MERAVFVVAEAELVSARLQVQDEERA